MTQRYTSRRLFLVLLTMSGLVFVATLGAAEEKNAAIADEGPLLIAQALPKPETGEHDLQYMLKRGEVLLYDVTHRASIRSTIDATTQAAQTKTDSVKAWKVTDVLPSGEIEFINVVERVHMINQLPDRDPVEYDSLRGNAPPPGFEDAAKAVGVPLSVVRITPRGKIVRRDVKLRGQNADEDAPSVVRLPEKPVNLGDTWDEPFDVQVITDSGANKSIQTRRHHKLTKVDDGIATIEVTYQVLSPIDAHIESQLVQRLMDGEVRFDIKQGRVVGQRMDIDKRILGFAGPTSSMQYIMRMEEKLLTTEPKVTVKATSKPRVSQRKPPRTTRTTNRSRTQHGTRSYRR